MFENKISFVTIPFVMDNNRGCSGVKAEKGKLEFVMIKTFFSNAGMLQ